MRYSASDSGIVGLDTSSLYRRTRGRTSRPAWFKTLQQMGAVLHSTNEPAELSQLHHKYTINNVLSIVIVRPIITIIADLQPCFHTCFVVYKLQISNPAHSA